MTLTSPTKRVSRTSGVDRTTPFVQWLWAGLLGALSGIRIQGLVNVGSPLAVLVVPSVIRRIRDQPGVRWPRIILGGFAAVVLLMPAMSVVGLLADPDRTFSTREFAKDLIRICSLGLVVCAILWSCTKARAEWVMATVSIGIALRYLIFPDVPTDELFKFRLGPTLPFIVLGLAARAPRPVQVAALTVVAAMSAYFNLRASLMASAIGAIALTASMIVPLLTKSRRPTRITTAIALLVTAGSVLVGGFTVPQLAEDGYFGTEIQRRQVSQETAGVGVFGARIEPGASIALAVHQPVGLGPGVMPSETDRQVAWQGLLELGVDPAADDFYAQYMREMMQGRIFLHSNLAETWWHYGIPGAILILVIAVFMGLRLTEQLTIRDPYLSGLVLYVTTRSLWDCLFEPVLPIGTNLMVATGFLLWLHLERRARADPDGEVSAVATPASGEPARSRRAGRAHATWPRTQPSIRTANRSAEKADAPSATRELGSEQA